MLQNALDAAVFMDGFIKAWSTFSPEGGREVRWLWLFQICIFQNEFPCCAIHKMHNG